MKLIALVSKYTEIFIISSVKGGAALTNIALAYVISNSYDANEAGIFFMMLAISVLASYFTRIGSDNYLIKSENFINANGKVTAKAYIGFLYLINIIATPLTFASCILFNKLTDNNISNNIIFYISLITALTSITNINSRVLQSSLKTVSSSIYMSLLTPTIFCITFTAITSSEKLEIENSILLYLICCLPSTILSIPSIRIQNPLTATYLPAIKESLNFLSTGSISLIIAWIGQFIAAYYLDLANSGWYFTIYKISMTINLLLIASSIYLSPRIAKYYSKNEIHNIEKEVHKINLASYIFSTACLIIIFSSSNLILELFNLPDSLSLALITLCLAQALNVATGNSVQILNMTGNNSLTRKSVYLSGIILIFLLAIIHLTPSLRKIENIAIIVSITLITQNLIASYYVYKKLGIKSFGVNKAHA